MEQQRIGKYDIVAKIGEGAMGEVFKAHDRVLNRYVAVKTMAALLTADDELVQRFRREAQSAAGLNHPNIVTIFDFAEEQGKFYMAMELLEGEDLKDIIARNGLNDLWDKIEVMEQICDGLAFAHAQGVVHRDLKPANIRILPNGRVKIMDFGLARLGESEMTRAGMVMGTPNYMSPEQVRGLKADQRSDIFSLGAVFYELISGKKAFQAPSMHSVLYKVLEEQPDPMRNWVPDLPPPFTALIDKALEKDTALRYQDAGALRAAVRAAREALASGSSQSGSESVDPAAATVYGAGEATMIEGAATSPRLRASIAGANALDLAPVPRAGRSKPPTLSGRAATQQGTAARSPGGPQPSRGGLYVVGGLVLVALAAGGGYLAFRGSRTEQPTAPAADLAKEQVGILTEELVRSRVELARVDLDNKDYRAAITEAQGALKIDPASADARDVIERAQAMLKELDETAAAARAAFAQGDTERASRSLARVLAIDPRHPVVAELSTALNQHFRGQADEARRATVDARTQALSLKAASFEGYADAERLLREADTLVQGEQFAVAAQKFLQSRDGFERARRGAEIATRQAAAARVVPSAVAPPTLMAKSQPVPLLPPVSVAPLVTQAPAVAPPPTQAVATAPAEDPALRRVIAEYGRAIESKDLALFRTVKPNLSADDAKRLQDAFKAIKTQQVGITVESVQIEGDQAVVKVARQDTINGKQVQRVQQTFRLAHAGGAWTIVSIGQ